MAMMRIPFNDNHCPLLCNFLNSWRKGKGDQPRLILDSVFGMLGAGCLGPSNVGNVRLDGQGSHRGDADAQFQKTVVNGQISALRANLTKANPGGKYNGS